MTEINQVYFYILHKTTIAIIYLSVTFNGGNCVFACEGSTGSDGGETQPGRDGGDELKQTSKGNYNVKHEVISRRSESKPGWDKAKTHFLTIQQNVNAGELKVEYFPNGSH